MNRPLTSLLILVPAVLLSIGACGGSAFESGAGGGGSGSIGGGANAGSVGVAGSSSTAGNPSTGGTNNVGGSTANGGSAASGGSGGIDPRACTSNTDCTVVPLGCCSCGLGPVSNFTAFNLKYASIDSRCAAVDCAPCPPIAPDFNDPTLYYVATCQAGRCAVVDLGATDITQCKSAADCSLRSGAGCCEGCGSQAIALNSSRESELSKLVCGKEPSACPACAPSFTGFSAGCSGGRCNVTATPCTAQSPCPL